MHFHEGTYARCRFYALYFTFPRFRKRNYVCYTHAHAGFADYATHCARSLRRMSCHRRAKPGRGRNGSPQADRSGPSALPNSLRQALSLKQHRKLESRFKGRWTFSCELSKSYLAFYNDKRSGELRGVGTARRRGQVSQRVPCAAQCQRKTVLANANSFLVDDSEFPTPQTPRWRTAACSDSKEKTIPLRIYCECNCLEIRMSYLSATNIHIL